MDANMTKPEIHGAIEEITRQMKKTRIPVVRAKLDAERRELQARLEAMIEEEDREDR